MFDIIGTKIKRLFTDGLTHYINSFCDYLPKAEEYYALSSNS
jgi:hypothetical protein